MQYSQKIPVLLLISSLAILTTASSSSSIIQGCLSGCNDKEKTFKDLQNCNLECLKANYSSISPEDPQY